MVYMNEFYSYFRLSVNNTAQLSQFLLPFLSILGDRGALLVNVRFTAKSQSVQEETSVYSDHSTLNFFLIFTEIAIYKYSTVHYFDLISDGGNVIFDLNCLSLGSDFCLSFVKIQWAVVKSNKKMKWSSFIMCFCTIILMSGKISRIFWNDIYNVSYQIKNCLSKKVDSCSLICILTFKIVIINQANMFLRGAILISYLTR